MALMLRAAPASVVQPAAQSAREFPWHGGTLPAVLKHNFGYGRVEVTFQTLGVT